MLSTAREKKMDDVSVCAPLLAESDTPNNTSSAPNAASVIDADKVINTKIDNSQGEDRISSSELLHTGDTDEEELLQCLLADTYCHVCDAVLTFEAQRLSHYEGKRHAQKVKVYLQTKRAEKTQRVFTGAQRTMTTDKNRFCELCNMVFTSYMVSKSHYEGKVHAKNLRKQGFQSSVINRNTEVSTLPRPTQDPDKPLQSLAAEGALQHHVDPGAPTTASSTEVDLKDPNKYCALCTASFNNPQMALQHYNGRKHQRNQSRQELMRRLGDDVQQANQLMCQMCSLEFNSVEMYQAHVQGSKHQLRKKKVVNLCNSQQKVYSSFADELADYVQVQKARGITPKTKTLNIEGDEEEEEEEEEDEEGVHQVLNTKRHITEVNTAIPVFTPTPDPLHLSGPGGFYPATGRRPSCHPHHWDYSCSPPVLPGPGSLQFTGRPARGRKRRRPSSSSSSSSSYTTSSSSHSSYSSSSSNSSDGDGSEYKRRERRRVRRSKKERGRRTRGKDSDEEAKRRSKKQRKEQEGEERPMAKRGPTVESEQRRRRQKELGKRRKDKKPRGGEFEEEGGDEAKPSLKPEDGVDSRTYSDVHIETEGTAEQQEGKRKEKKKVKEKADTRTEDEKLWDDSILGC